MSKHGRTRLIYAIFSEEFIFLMFPMKIFFISVTTTSRILKIRYRLYTSCRKFFTKKHVTVVLYRYLLGFFLSVLSFVALRSRKKELVLIAVAQYVNVKGKYIRVIVIILNIYYSEE